VAEHLLLPKRLARAMPWLGAWAQTLEAGLLRALVGLLRLLPLDWSFALARGLMRLLGPLTPMWDKVARNHAIAFPEMDAASRRRLRRQTFGHLGEAIAELVLAPRIHAETRRIEWRVAPGLEAALEAGKPLVMVTGHVGAWQLTNLVSLHYKIPLACLYAEESNPRMAALMLELRNGLGCRWLPSAGGIRTLLEELRAGHSVGLACDTRMDQGEAVPFFGHSVMSNTVPARLALRLGAPLVPVLAERLTGGHYRITLEEPVQPGTSDATQAEQALAMTAALMTRFETWVRSRPAQWMCLARRFPKELDKAARHQ
jgi:KDO2-lipid IV(A) lauroyltransferase